MAVNSLLNFQPINFLVKSTFLEPKSSSEKERTNAL